jgi:hypothetical protein
MNSVTSSTSSDIGIRLRRASCTALLGCAAVLLLATLTGCSAPWHKGRDDPRLGENCVRNQSDRAWHHHDPTARAINYVDPELCNRAVDKRGPYHVRTEPTPLEVIAGEEN